MKREDVARKRVILSQLHFLQFLAFAPLGVGVGEVVFVDFET